MHFKMCEIAAECGHSGCLVRAHKPSSRENAYGRDIHRVRVAHMPTRRHQQPVDCLPCLLFRCHHFIGMRCNAMTAWACPSPRPLIWVDCVGTWEVRQVYGLERKRPSAGLLIWRTPGTFDGEPVSVITGTPVPESTSNRCGARPSGSVNTLQDFLTFNTLWGIFLERVL